MELHDLIHSKGFETNLTLKLLEIARNGNVVEDLINFAANATNDKIEELEEEITRLQDENAELKFANERLKQFEAKTSSNVDHCAQFIANFLEENKRYPSIDEAWEACEQRWTEN